MNAFLAVAQGSAEEPIFLEVIYEGAKSSSEHVALVGKGKKDAGEVVKVSFHRVTNQLCTFFSILSVH